MSVSNTRKTNLILNCKISSAVYEFYRKIFKAIYKLPFSTLIRKSIDFFNSQISSILYHFNFKISCVSHYLNSAVERNVFVGAVFFINWIFGSLFHGFLNGGLFGFVAEQQRQNQ